MYSLKFFSESRRIKPWRRCAFLPFLAELPAGLACVQLEQQFSAECVINKGWEIIREDGAYSGGLIFPPAYPLSRSRCELGSLASTTVTIWDITSEEMQPNIWFGRLHWRCLITTVGTQITNSLLLASVHCAVSTNSQSAHYNTDGRDPKWLMWSVLFGKEFTDEE